MDERRKNCEFNHCFNHAKFKTSGAVAPIKLTKLVILGTFLTIPSWEVNTFGWLNSCFWLVNPLLTQMFRSSHADLPDHEKLWLFICDDYNGTVINLRTKSLGKWSTVIMATDHYTLPGDCWQVQVFPFMAGKSSIYSISRLVHRWSSLSPTWPNRFQQSLRNPCRSST